MCGVEGAEWRGVVTEKDGGSAVGKPLWLHCMEDDGKALGLHCRARLAGPRAGLCAVGRPIGCTV